MTNAIPPYFNISPNTALSELDQPVFTKSFQALAQASIPNLTKLSDNGTEESNRKQLRLFSTWEITRYLIPVAAAHFRRVLKQNPGLPQGRSETDGGAKWFTLNEVLQLKTHFGTEGSKTKEYLPYHPKGLPAKIVTVANSKSGTGKTSTCAHLAMSAALDGYKVLVIDLDAQGAATSIFGGHVADEWQTVFPLLARHYARHLRTQNRIKMDRGEAPIPLDDTLDKALKTKATDIIQSTHWPNIDLIGAQLNLCRSEFQIPEWRLQTRSWTYWSALSEALKTDRVLGTYDLIFIDTPPALGYLTINGLTAADIMLVPLGAQVSEFTATRQFFNMLYATFQSIEESENIAARALGTEEISFEWEAVRAVITRYDAAHQAELAGLMQASLGPTLSPHYQAYSELIGAEDRQVPGIYEADYRDFNRETYARGRETFDATYAAFKRLLLGLWRRDELDAKAEGIETLLAPPL
jgi:chromosome partitioning protein